MKDYLKLPPTQSTTIYDCLAAEEVEDEMEELTHEVLDRMGVEGEDDYLGHTTRLLTGLMHVLCRLDDELIDNHVSVRAFNRALKNARKDFAQQMANATHTRY